MIFKTDIDCQIELKFFNFILATNYIMINICLYHHKYIMNVTIQLNAVFFFKQKCLMNLRNMYKSILAFTTSYTCMSKRM